MVSRTSAASAFGTFAEVNRDSSMFSVHSKPNGQKPDHRLADQDIIRKMIAGQRLPNTYTPNP